MWEIGDNIMKLLEMSGLKDVVLSMYILEISP